MDTIALSEIALARGQRLFGKLHPFDSVDPCRTALLVIDMQNYFVKPGHQGEVPLAREIVPKSIGSPPSCAASHAAMSHGSTTGRPIRGKAGRLSPVADDLTSAARSRADSTTCRAPTGRQSS
jgi:nicotinamidase-related amidase